MGRSNSVVDIEKLTVIADEDRDATPSFALLDVQGPVIVTYVYQLVDGEVCSTIIHSTGSSLLCTRPSQTFPSQTRLPQGSLLIQRPPACDLPPPWAMSFDEAHHDGA
jgi:hypothetical protein